MKVGMDILVLLDIDCLAQMNAAQPRPLPEFPSLEYLSLLLLLLLLLTTPHHNTAHDAMADNYCIGFCPSTTPAVVKRSMSSVIMGSNCAYLSG
jgi:hypothetical protein